MNHKNSMLAKARSPNPDINSIPEIYDKTQKAIEYIDILSEHDPTVSKAITSCTAVAIYTRESEVDDPFLILDEIAIDHVDHISLMADMLDDGTWTSSSNKCPHESECGDSDCGTCIFAPLRTIDVAELRCSFQVSLTSGSTNTNHKH